MENSTIFVDNSERHSTINSTTNPEIAIHDIDRIQWVRRLGRLNSPKCTTHVRSKLAVTDGVGRGQDVTTKCTGKSGSVQRQSMRICILFLPRCGGYPGQTLAHLARDLRQDLL